MMKNSEKQDQSSFRPVGRPTKYPPLGSIPTNPEKLARILMTRPPLKLKQKGKAKV